MRVPVAEYVRKVADSWTCFVCTETCNCNKCRNVKIQERNDTAAESQAKTGKNGVRLGKSAFRCHFCNKRGRGYICDMCETESCAECSMKAGGVC
jgi:hypothetical protein